MFESKYTPWCFWGPTQHACSAYREDRLCVYIYIYIYMYAFSRHFYPKRLTVNSGYTIFCQYVTTHNAMLYHWATAEHIYIYIYMFLRLRCGSVVEHCVVGLIPREHILTKKCIAWIHCKSLWIKASAKCIHVNVNIYMCVYVCGQKLHVCKKQNYN